MNKESEQDRNRLVNVMNNCAKLSALRAETSDTPLPRKCKQLASRLADSHSYGSAVEELMKRYTQFNDLQNILKDKTAEIPEEFISRSINSVEWALSVCRQKENVAAAFLNSAEYFEGLQERETKELDELRRRQTSLENEKKTGTREYRDTVLEINVRQAKLQEIQERLEEKHKTKDKIEVLKERINPLVTNLTEAVSGLEKEISKLNIMFYVYLVLIILVFAFLIFWESFLIYKLHDKLPGTDWRFYLAFYLPIPLAAGLLWTFIYQMNCMQQQSVGLNAKMHSLRYKDSLLKMSAQLYSDQSKNEEHVAILIDAIMKEKNDGTENTFALAKGALPSVPIDKIIELIKAYQGK